MKNQNNNLSTSNDSKKVATLTVDLTDAPPELP